MDVKELFETQIPVGPEHRPMTDRIAVGRRALQRRRRASVGAASVAVVAVVGAVGAVVNVGDLRSDRDNPPTTSTSSPTASPTYTPPPPDEGFTNAIPATLNRGGCVDSSTYDQPEMPCFEDMLDQSGKEGLRRREDVQISQRIDDPVTGPEIDKSIALEATYHGVTQWVYVEWGERGGLLQANPTTDVSFQDWADGLNQLNPPEGRNPEWEDAEGSTRIGIAAYDREGKLLIHPDAEVLDRVDNPLEHPDDGSVAIAAEVGGVVWWTLQTNWPTQVFGLQRADNGDFEAWVDKAVRDAYSQNSAIHFGIDDNGKLVTKDDWTRVVDQISDPDIDWVTEPGEHSVLVQYKVTNGGPGGRRFTLIRTRNSLFEGAIETVSFRYHPEKDTLQTILARLQKENRP